MPRRQPASASRAQSSKIHSFGPSTDSKNSCNPACLRSKRDALPMPQSPIDRPEPSHVEEIDALHALESDDYLKVRAALAKIDPKVLLDQLTSRRGPSG